MKKIIFDSIRFDDRQLVWDYDETNHTAKCTFALAGTPKLGDVNNILRELEQIEGITIENSEATIADTRSFFKAHTHRPLVPPRELVSPRGISHSGFFNSDSHSLTRGSSSAQAGVSPTSFNRLDLASIATRSDSAIPTRTPTPRVITPREYNDIAQLQTTTSSSSIPSVKFFEGGIKIDDLITESDKSNAGLWSDTLAYRDHFLNKSAEDNQWRVYKFIRSESNLTAENQYKINAKLYPLKNKVILILQQIFDGPLNETFEALQSPQKYSMELKKYLQGVIQKVMKYSPLDSEPTSTERYTGEQRERFYPIAADYEFAVNEERLGRARTRIRALLFFTQDNINSTTLTSDNEVSEVLDALKQRLSNTNRILILRYIADLLEAQVAIGILQAEVPANKQALEQQIMSNSQVINGFYSYRTLLQHVLSPRSHKLKCIDQVITEILVESIKRVKKFTTLPDRLNLDTSFEPLVGKVGVGDKNFYVCPELCPLLYQALNNLTILKQLEKSATRPNAITLIGDALEETLRNWISEHSQQHSLSEERNTTSFTASV